MGVTRVSDKRHKQKGSMKLNNAIHTQQLGGPVRKKCLFEEINSLLTEAIPYIYTVWVANEQHISVGFRPGILE